MEQDPRIRINPREKPSRETREKSKAKLRLKPTPEPRNAPDYLREYEEWDGPKNLVPDDVLALEHELGIEQTDTDQALVFHREPSTFIDAAWRRRWWMIPLTLGLALAWESQRVRQELWANTRFCGRPFHWRGNEAAAKYAGPTAGFVLLGFFLLFLWGDSYFYTNHISFYVFGFDEDDLAVWLFWGTILFGLPLWAWCRTFWRRYQRLCLVWNGIPLWFGAPRWPYVLRSFVMGLLFLLVGSILILPLWFVFTVLSFFLIEDAAEFMATCIIGVVFPTIFLPFYLRAADLYFINNTWFGRTRLWFSSGVFVLDYSAAVRAPLLLGGLASILAAWVLYEIGYFLNLEDFLFPLLVLPAGFFGISSMVKARLYNLRANHTSMRGASGFACLTAFDVLRYYYGGMVLTALTLGYLFPRCLARWHQVLCDSTFFCGRLQVRDFEQELRR